MPKKKFVPSANDKKVYAFVKKCPGCRGEEVSRALALEPAQTGYVLWKLRDKKLVKGRGQTRAMEYTVTAKAL